MQGHLTQQRSDADAGNSPVDSLKVYGEHNDKGRGKKLMEIMRRAVPRYPESLFSWRR